MEKGDYGYLKSYKKKKILGISVYAVLIIIGLLLSSAAKGMTGKLLIVFSVLLVLPGAKVVTAFLLAAKYHTYDREIIDKLEKSCAHLNDPVFIYDAIITSTESVMYLPFIVIYHNKVYGLFQDITKKVTISSTKEYLKEILLEQGRNCTVTLESNVDVLAGKLEKIKNNDSDEWNKDDDLKTKHKLLIYSV